MSETMKYTVASCHQGDAKFGKFAGKQCVANCAAFLCLSEKKDTTNLGSQDLDYVLHTGTMICSQVCAFVGEEYLIVNELPRKIRIGASVFKLSIGFPSTRGVMSDYRQQFSSQLVDIFTAYPAVFIVCKVSCVALKFEAGKYFLFDPHSMDPNTKTRPKCLPCPFGFACLMIFDSFDRLLQHCKDLFTSNCSDEYELIPCKLDKTLSNSQCKEDVFCHIDSIPLFTESDPSGHSLVTASRPSDGSPAGQSVSISERTSDAVGQPLDPPVKKTPKKKVVRGFEWLKAQSMHRKLQANRFKAGEMEGEELEEYVAWKEARTKNGQKKRTAKKAIKSPESGVRIDKVTARTRGRHEESMSAKKASLPSIKKSVPPGPKSKQKLVRRNPSRTVRTDLYDIDAPIIPDEPRPPRLKKKRKTELMVNRIDDGDEQIKLVNGKFQRVNAKRPLSVTKGQEVVEPNVPLVESESVGYTSASNSLDTGYEGTVITNPHLPETENEVDVKPELLVLEHGSPAHRLEEDILGEDFIRTNNSDTGVMESVQEDDQPTRMNPSEEQTMIIDEDDLNCATVDWAQAIINTPVESLNEETAEDKRTTPLEPNTCTRPTGNLFASECTLMEL